MASSLIVPVVEVRNIREHPNADMLSVVEVLGYQIVTALVEDPDGPIIREFVAGERNEKGFRIPAKEKPDAPREQVRYRFRYKEGDRGVYFPADTVLPDNWVDEFGVRPYVKTGNRIGRARLRGEPSFGLLVEVPAGQQWELGQNVADYYGAKKWEPDPNWVRPEDCAPYDSAIDSLFEKYTDIEDGKLLYSKFLPGEQVVVTEKLHGRNCRVGIIVTNDGTDESELVAGSRTYRIQVPVPDSDDPEDFKQNMFWSPLADDGVRDLLYHCRANIGCKVVILYGEVIGRGVQSTDYGFTKDKGFRAFDLYVDGNYLDYDEFAELCDRFGVGRVPVLYRGPFDLKKINELAEGLSTLPGANHPREGVVVRPALERRDPALGRVVLKFIGTEFDLSKHKEKDTADR